MTTKTLLLCLALFMAAAAQNYQPVSNFDSSKLIGTKWYEAFYADNSTELLDACTRYVFTCTSNNKIIYQYGYYEPGLNGDFISSTLTIKQSGNSGTFQVTTSGQTGQLIILDYASDYSWIVIADTNGGYLSVLSKTSLNLTGLQRALDLAEYYGQDSQHLELQVSQCPYSSIFSALAKARQSL
jgi:lipocalin